MTEMKRATAQSDKDYDRLADWQLIGLAKGRDEAAVRILIRRHNRLLFRTVRGMVRDDAEAEDIVQETYVRAFTRLDQFRGDSAFSTWLSRIAINEGLGRLRRKRPTTGLATLETASGANGDQVIMFPTVSTPARPDVETAREQIRAFLERAVDRLAEHYRVVFILRDVEGLSTEEAASHLSLRPETVKTRLHRARKLLRESIESELSSGFSDLFPFDGDRCRHMADRVIGRLRQDGSAADPK